MSIGRDAPCRLAATVLFLLIALLSTGCRLVVEEPAAVGNDTQFSAMSGGVMELPEYDAAVSAIDFDPPLKRDALVSLLRPVKLQVAVENKGIMPLTNLVVEARITSQKGDFSASDRVRVSRLSPGEVRLVEFEGVSPPAEMPASSSYRIRVTVEGQRTDANPRNDSRDVVVRVVD